MFKIKEQCVAKTQINKFLMVKIIFMLNIEKSLNKTVFNVKIK